MIKINASDLNFEELNDAVRSANDDVEISDCLGQRFIGAGLSDKNITVKGTPGNALGAYLNGATINVFGNAQDAVGDTMNDGEIIVRGNIGDCAGYAMRGGKIFVKGNAGYRAGIHMKAYKENPDNFKGSIADISNMIRVALTSKTTTPDLYEIIKLLGKDRVLDRLSR